MKIVWEQALTIIRERVDAWAYERWFANGSIVGVEKVDRFIYIIAADAIVKESLTRLYGDIITEVVSAYFDEDVKIFILDDQTEKVPDPREAAATPEERKKPCFNPRYTFDSFIVGSSNRFAHAAALSVAEAPASSYNPLFLYGGSGLGKTHLMHAIGQEVEKRFPKKRVVMVTSEEFTNEFISLLRIGKLEGFKNRFRTADLLLIDDIQFLIGKKETQEEFFHTFNALHDAGKQLVICSDRPPGELSPLEDRLRSRFEWGLTVDITPPDWETRCAILQQKAIDEQMKVDDEVIYLIAEKVYSNIRELEGTLNKVINLARITHRNHVDIELAKEALRNLLINSEPVKLTNSYVQKTVAEYYQVTVEDMKSAKKDRFIARPRMVAMYLCREMVGSTLPQIGRDFGGRDHTTVMHACKTIGSSRKTEAQLERAILEIEKNLKFGGK